MTTNMQELSRAYHRGIEVGRAAAKHEADEFAALTAATTMHVGDRITGALGEGHIIAVSDSKSRETTQKSPKSTKVARGVKKAAGPRTPGVKKGILSLISSTAMSTADIIARTGFNDNSVRATLMSLKKSGLAMSDDGLWIATSHMSGDGNSETALEDARY